MERLLSADFAEDAAVSERRILWTNAARLKNTGVFKKSGLYLWGVRQCPIYLGMTAKQTFQKRFGRYIWQGRSQCNLAKTEGLIEHGMELFLADPAIMEWNRNNGLRYNPRMRAAVRFAREGIDDVWFALFPLEDPQSIKPLEKRLIPIANRWNLDRGLPPLENVENNTR